MFANRGIYHDGWYAGTTPPASAVAFRNQELPDLSMDYKWELYNIAEDFSQNNDLAAKNPDKLKELQALFVAEANKIPGLPAGQLGAAAPPDAASERDGRPNEFTYTGENVGHSGGQCARASSTGTTRSPPKSRSRRPAPRA